MIQDNHRPTYHHLPPEGLLWDPCAAIFWQGRYHLFYLHSSWAKSGPPRRLDGYIYKAWAHISSADLVHWTQHPNALERGQTGNIFLLNKTPTIVFPHPDGGGASCFASNPARDLEQWHFDPKAPVLRHPVQGNRLYANSNDVTAWQEGEWCYALTGTRDITVGDGDAQHLFRSRDLATWEYCHQFYKSERRWTDAQDDCACPDFFQFGDRWMLLHFCHRRPWGSRYYLGHYENQRFYPDTFDRINWPGGNIHAPRTMLDAQGRRILFVNLNEGRSQAACEASGWSGVLSLPVVISPASDGKSIRYAPVAELQALRQGLYEQHDLTVEADIDRPLAEVRGDCLELELEMAPNGATEFGVKLRCAPDGTEETSVFFSVASSTIQIDYQRASLCDDLTYQSETWVQSAPFDFEEDDLVKLRVFLDHSVLEVFAGDQRYLAQRIYPMHPDTLGVKLFSRGGDTVVRKLRAWQMEA
ncbi:MAG: glycoside hydrolase family 32 protein [Chloroflexota bacterium]